MNTNRKSDKKSARKARRLPLLTSAAQQQILMALQEIQKRGELNGQPSHPTLNAELQRLGFPGLKPSTISKALLGLEQHGYIRRPLELAA